MYPSVLIHKLEWYVFYTVLWGWWSQRLCYINSNDSGMHCVATELCTAVIHRADTDKQGNVIDLRAMHFVH